MKFALLIYEDETFWSRTPPEELGPMMEGYQRFGETAGERIRSGEALQPTATATSVRVRDGERLLTDGPFAETKEQLGGFYVLECENLDEAIEWAAKIPGAQSGCVEVRPVMDYDAMQAGSETSQAAAS
jgi:hypothetical protein